MAAVMSLRKTMAKGKKNTRMWGKDASVNV